MLQGVEWAFSVTQAEVSVLSYKSVRTWSIVTGCRSPHGGWAFTVTNSNQRRFRQLYFVISRAILAYQKGGEQWTHRRILGWSKRSSLSSCIVCKAIAWATSIVSCMVFYRRCATGCTISRKHCSIRSPHRILSFLIFPFKKKERKELNWNRQLEISVFSYKLPLEETPWSGCAFSVTNFFEGNSTPCDSFVSPQIRVRVNAHFVTLNARFVRVNAHFVTLNAYFGWPLEAFFRICNTKRSLHPFKWRRVCVYLYNWPISFWSAIWKSKCTGRKTAGCV